jgi:hypothetical protein
MPGTVKGTGKEPEIMPLITYPPPRRFRRGAVAAVPFAVPRIARSLIRALA